MTVREVSAVGELDLPASLVDALVRSAVATPAALARTALRQDLVGVEEIISRAGSDGLLGHGDVLAAAASRQQVPDGLRSNAAYALGLLAAGRADITGDVPVAADLLALGRRLAGRDGTRLEHVDLEVQTNVLAGQVDHARRCVAAGGVEAWIAWAMEADLLNPWARPGLDHAAWAERFNTVFEAHGLLPVVVDAEAAVPYDTLRTTEDVAGRVSGPLVSIVVPAFRPTQSLLSSVRSVLAQSWRDLEVIVVDDASGADFESVFEEVAALDQRVRVVHLQENGGAYRARAAGIARAGGSIIGHQDADDWSHPQRLERQMALMQSEAAPVACLSKAIRLHADMTVTRLGSRPLRQNAPSLLVRAEVLRDQLGGFDDVRKAADTELIERLQTVHGEDAVPVLEEPLTLYQLTTGSLSRTDFRLGWHKHSRFSYHSAFKHWHARIAEGSQSPRLVPGAPRPYPAPPEIAGGSWPAEPYDVVLWADWRGEVPRSTGLPSVAAAWASGGVRLGLARGEPVRFSLLNRRRPQAAVSELVASGGATWTPLGADVRTRVLVVADPELLVCPPDPATVALRADHVVIAADLAPAPEGSDLLAYDPGHVERVVQTIFGVRPSWLPATPSVAGALAAHAARGRILEPEPVDVAAPVPPVRRGPQDRPVVGVHDTSVFTSDHLDPTLARRVLAAQHDLDVRVLSRGRRLAGLDGVLLLDAEEVSDEAFWLSCDVVLGLPTQRWGAGSVRPLVEAMNLGCLPVLHPVHREVFGDAATYLDPSAPVGPSVRSLWADAAVEDRRDAARAWCRRRRPRGLPTAVSALLQGAESP